MKRSALIAAFLCSLFLIDAASLKTGADSAGIAAEMSFSDDAVPMADQFFAGDGSALTAAKWGPDGGPFTSNFVAGNVANFNVVNGTGSGAGGITVAGLNAAENFTYSTPTGTLTTGGTVAPVTVSAGKTLDLGTLSISTAVGTGFTKNGDGVFATGGGTYAGGFTLNSGTIVARGVNSMGSGASNTLTINGGVIAANATRDLSNRYGSGITVGGNFQLGEFAANVPLSSDTANLTFNNNMSFGAATRTIKIGANGTYTLGGVISGAAGTGLVVENAVGATGVLVLSGANTYTGPTTLTSGILSVATIGNGGVAGGIGQATNAAANLVFDGGTLRYTGSNATTNRNFTINPGKTATIDVTANDLTLSGAAIATNGGLTKSGAGVLNLSGTNLYTGDTVINPGGALALITGGSIANSQVIEIKGGGFFDVSSLTTALTLASGQAIRASGTTASGTIATVVTKGLTTAADSPLIFTAFNGTTAPLTIQGSGTVTVASGNPVTVNTTTALGIGDYTLIAKGPTGTVAGAAPTSLTIGGSGLGAGTAGSLVITGGQLVLRVVAGDTTPPTITYTSLTNTQSTANRVLTATIADAVGVANGALLPRIYFRKNAGSYFSTQCVLASGNAQNGTYDCTVDNSLVGGVTAFDAIGYFVIAQDAAGNVASNPAGVVATNVNTVTTPPSPNSYTILPSNFAGAYSVGTGEVITSLTNNGGLFQLMNAGSMSANVAINITSNLTAETGTHALNQQAETGAGGYTLLFQASGGARLIEGASPLGTGLITLNGADRVTFSGLASGPGGLTFRNTGNAPTIRFINDSTFDGIVNCVVEGGQLDLDSGVVLIGNGTTTGNDNISITDSTIRDRTDAAAVPANLIRNSGNPPVLNSNTVLSNNQLINFTQAGIFITNAESSTVSGNNISQTAARASDLFGLSVQGSGLNTVSNNVVRDQNTTDRFTGISVEIDGSITLSANRIFNIENSTSNNFPWVGIQLVSQVSGSTTTAVNNMVSMVPSASSGLDFTGILIDGAAGNFNVNHNSVLLGGPATGDSWALRRNAGSTTTVSLMNNIFFNDRSGSANHFAASDGAGGMGSWSSNYNVFVGAGATAANFFDYNGTAVNVAGWQTGPPARDANSLASVRNVGPFNVGNMFTSPNDLHLRTIGNNPAINAGTDTGLTTDFDGQLRPFNGTPDIGADEVQSVPTAGDALVSGRALMPNGRGVRNVRVVVTGGDLTEPRLAVTNAFGYFTITGLRAGRTYLVSVSGKRFVFEPPARVVALSEDAFNIDFLAEPR